MMNTTPATDLDSLARRVARLERDYRRVVAAGLTSASLLAAFVLFGAADTTQTSQGGPVEIKHANGVVGARLTDSSLNLYDNNGNVRLSVWLDTSGHPGVRMYDENQVKREDLYLSNPGDNPEIDFADPRKATRLELYLAKEDNEGNLRFYDRSSVERLSVYEAIDAHDGVVSAYGADGKPRIEITGSDKPFFRLHDAGQERGFFGAYADGSMGFELDGPDAKKRVTLVGSDSPYLRLTDGNGQQRFYAGVYTEGNSGLNLYGSDGKLRVVLDGSDGPFVRIRDRAGQERVYAGLYTDGTSGYELFNASGKIIWSAP